MPQHAPITITKPGGRRTANYGNTFLERKHNLLTSQSIENAYLIECGCASHCVWRAANALPDFSDRVKELRELRFAGKSCLVAKCAHLRFSAVEISESVRTTVTAGDRPGGENIVRLPCCTWAHFLALWH